MKVPIAKIESENFDFTDYVTSFVYEDSAKEDSMVEITLHLPNLVDLLDSGTFESGVVLTFTIGFVGGPFSEPHSVVITDYEVKYSTLTLVVSALDSGVALKRIESDKIWGEMTSSQIAKEIATKYKLDTEVTDTTKIWEKDSLPQAGRSDFEFLRYLASIEDGGDFITYVRNSKLYFTKRGLDKDSLYSYNYGYDDDIIEFAPSYKDSTQKSEAESVTTKSYDYTTNTDIDTTTDELDVESISLGTYENSFLSGSINSVVEEGSKLLDFGGSETSDETTNKGAFKRYDGVTGLEIEVVDDVNTETDNEVVQNTVSEDISSIVGKSIAIPEIDLDEVSNISNSLKKDAALKVLVAELTVEGNPLIEPDNIITMQGKLAKKHIGNWYIDKITHKIGSSAYVSIVSMAKNGTEQDIKSDGGVAEKVTTKSTTAVVNTTVAESKGEDKIIINVYDEDGILIGQKTESGKYIPVK